MLYAIGKQAIAASISFVIVVLNLALNFLFIPDWSWFQPTLIIPSWISPSGQTHIISITNHTGAAMALIIANLVGFVLLRYCSWKCIKTGFYHGVTVKHVFASTIMILPLIYLNRVHELLRWYDLILYTLVGLGIYLLVLYLLKEFDRSDLKFYLDLMNPKGLSDYITKELKEKDLTVAMETMSGTEKGSGKKDRPSKVSPGKAPRRRDEEE
jgi:putative flippase GtrA